MPTKLLPLAAGIFLAWAGPVAAKEGPSADQVQAILKSHCYRCHGQDGAVEGGMNYITDLGKLIARKKIIPGDPDKSRLFRRIDEGTMPPPDEKHRPSPAQVAVIKQWIETGAGSLTQSSPPSPLALGNIHTLVLADLEKLDRRSRRFQRYFTFTHLAAAGLTDEELQTYRNALAKLVNSLSWSPRITVPVAIDPARTILRIDLRWFVWDSTTWNRILTDYPYGVLDDSTTARAVSVATAAKLPVIRGDWFVATASRAPLYYDLLQLPTNLTELERQLRVDAAADIQQERVIRVGFNGSGISRFNRILERHDSAQGMYWRTYDFDEPPANLAERANGNQLPDRRNIFAFPLGPTQVETPFQHAGGEAIFALPNGLHAYYLVKADNTRLDKGPIALVSDPKRPDRAVEAGVSCMSCHVTGILPKSDQMRDHLAKNPKAFSRAEAEQIRALYPPAETSLAVMHEDGKRYAEAVARTGARVSRTEAVSLITQKYEADLDLAAAAAEVGLTPTAFRDRLSTSETLTRHVGGLRAAGATVSRAGWVQAFGDLTRELRLGTPFLSGLNGPNLPDNTGELDPLESRDGAANGIAFSADGRRAVIASADRSVRIHDVEGRRDLKRLIGHTASVWAVALSADGKWAASGGMDGTVRVWEIASGRELKRFTGHESLVAAVSFTPDGTQVVSGGLDGAVILWDITSGRELRRWEGKAKAVAAVAIDPTGSFALIAADRTLYRWDLHRGEVNQRLEGHTAAVSCVALSGDGKRAVSGGDDRTVRIWDLTTGKQLASPGLHEGALRSVAFSADGKWAVSASADRTVRLWAEPSNREAAVFRKHTAGVIGVTFLANGRQTLSSDREPVMLAWNIEKFLTAPAVKGGNEMIPYAVP